MKIRNKKTGEIAEASVLNFELVVRYDDGRVEKYPLLFDYSNFEDYEEPKVYWYLNGRGEIRCIEDEDTEFDRDHKEIGNYFEAYEEAEKAVEKLKAITRLKSCGFKFKGWRTADLGADKYYFVITAESDGAGKGDLDLLFGDEE